MGDNEYEFRIIRDPIHGYVCLSKNESGLLDTPIFQRLRRIKQLANSHLVYPSAVHSRFEHSLGVIEIAYRIACRISSIKNDGKKIKAIRYAALLHDLGHGPFSHVFEDILARINDIDSFSHETITKDFIINDEEINSLLKDDVDNVLNLLFEENNRYVEHCIISGPIDADKFDYLLRDSYHAGVAYGIFDKTRMIYTLKEIKGGFLDSKESYLGAERGGLEAVLGMVLANYYMYESVYSHKTRRIADSMLIRSMELALQNDESIERDSYIYKKNDPDFLNFYKELDDIKLLNLLLNSKYEKAKYIANLLYLRRLYKPIYGKDIGQLPTTIRPHILNLNRIEAKKMEEKIGEIIHVDPDFVIVDRQSISNPLYREPYGSPSQEPIYFQDKNGEVSELSDIPTPLSRTASRTVERFWVYAPVIQEKRIKMEKDVKDFVEEGLRG